MTDTTVDLVVRFRDGRIGRQRNVPDLAVSVPFYDDGDPDWDNLCEQVFNYARPRLASSDIDVGLGQSDTTKAIQGVVCVGGMRVVAHFTLHGIRKGTHP